MSASAPAPRSSSDRFGILLERRDDADFPFYDGRPVRLPAWRWMLALAGCVVAYLTLVLPPVATPEQGLAVRLIATGIGVGSVVVAWGRHAASLVRRPRWADLGVLAVFLLLTIISNAVVGLLFAAAGVSTNANSIESTLLDPDPVERVLFFIGFPVQMVLEQLLITVPFLAGLAAISAAGVSRKPAVVVSTLGAAVLFGLLHLHAYDWNVLQCVLAIGVISTLMHLTYVRTKNILVAWAFHVLYDLASFAVIMAGPSPA
ncbi:CPBP family intramembrane glutamic endopeptidase [Salinibacterium soli]|uniref:CPBP family intramembrane metalloprotease n=1 Tax=Antiquaquibacter soli TaxID=3064523 RepID=A0ABT9BIR6_9MICO|nr:CPBP family intramembrane glutamic endopeptidase [Protaetiibacter sp. WY-16]MDO7880905.1 CPBP family intramembrane metalloprotease [Protaetiibacter sp. WY-16]